MILHLLVIQMMSAGLNCDCVDIPDVDPLHPSYWFGKENYCWDRAKVFSIQLS